MLKKLVLILAVLALVVSAGTPTPAGHYRITLTEPAVVGDTLLKAGDYRLTLLDTKVTFTPDMGKTSVEATVKVEPQTKKYDDTVVGVSTASGKAVVTEIRLGGTKTRLVFSN